MVLYAECNGAVVISSYSLAKGTTNIIVIYLASVGFE